MFTRQQIEEIRKGLALYSKKDTQFDVASLPIDGSEEIAFVQKGKNVKMNLKELMNNLLLFRASDFINLSSILSNKFTLEEAIKAIPSIDRKVGVVITYIDKNIDDWVIFQYKSKSISDWFNLEYWKSILDEGKFKGYFANECLLYSICPAPQIGDYAFVGDTLGTAVIYRCINNGTWSVTDESALDYVKVIVAGDITVGENGNWFQNGIDTGIKAQGPKGDKGDNIKGDRGDTPVLRLYNGYIQYGYDGVNWNNLVPVSDFKVINSPDEEDITSVNDKLKLADKTYNAATFSGLGRKYLRKNITGGKNILTDSMINTPNTIYIIQYDFDLNGATLNVPANCILQFEGGSISNGTLKSSCEITSSGKYRIFNNIKFSTIQPCVGYPEWFGAKGDGISDDYDAISSALNSFSKVILLCKTYLIKVEKEKLFNLSSNMELKGTSSMGSTSQLLISDHLTDAECTVVNISGSFIRVSDIIIKKTTVSSSRQEEDYHDTAFNIEGHNILLEEVTIVGFHTAVAIGSYLTRLIGINCHHCYNGFKAYSSNKIMTSLYLLQCYAWEIANIGYSFYGYNYSQLDNCAGDECSLTYSIDNCVGIQLNSCASEKSYRYIYIANSQAINLNNTRVIIKGLGYSGTQDDYQHTITLSKNIACVFNNLHIKVGSASKYYTDTLIAIEGYTSYQYAQYTFIGAYLDAGIKFAECIKAYSGYTEFNMVSLINSSIVSCREEDLPSLPSSIRYLSVYVRDRKRNAYFTGEKWQDDNGFTFMRNKGNTSQRPTITDSEDSGFMYYDTTLKKYIVWDNTQWIDGNGNKALSTKGVTSERPTLTTSDEGFTFYDSTLKKMILWNGTAWVNMDGTVLA